jgi:hypothetical protein
MTAVRKVPLSSRSAVRPQARGPRSTRGRSVQRRAEGEDKNRTHQSAIWDICTCIFMCSNLLCAFETSVHSSKSLVGCCQLCTLCTRTIALACPPILAGLKAVRACERASSWTQIHMYLCPLLRQTRHTLTLCTACSTRASSRQGQGGWPEVC